MQLTFLYKSASNEYSYLMMVKAFAEVFLNEELLVG